MQDDDFEWDDAKAARNWLVHGIAFESARAAFDDPLSVDWVDTGHDDTEERLGMVGVAFCTYPIP